MKAGTLTSFPLGKDKYEKFMVPYLGNDLSGTQVFLTKAC